LKFLYKIHSGYDGFIPARLPQRMTRGLLTLGWARYLDAVEVGDEVWVYFHGPHRFANGVYAKGLVRYVDLDAGSVRIRLREWRTDQPLSDSKTTASVAEVVATRYRQVFLLPEEWQRVPVCSVNQPNVRRAGVARAKAALTGRACLRSARNR
jgi:hypothetical protein